MRRIALVLLLSFAAPFATGLLCDARCTSAEHRSETENRACHQQDASTRLSQPEAAGTVCHRAVELWTAAAPERVLPPAAATVAPVPAASRPARSSPLPQVFRNSFTSAGVPPIGLPLRI